MQLFFWLIGRERAVVGDYECVMVITWLHAIAFGTDLWMSFVAKSTLSTSYPNLYILIGC
jgi:hypothetical protein